MRQTLATLAAIAVLAYLASPAFGLGAEARLTDPPVQPRNVLSEEDDVRMIAFEVRATDAIEQIIGVLVFDLLGTLEADRVETGRLVHVHGEGEDVLAEGQFVGDGSGQPGDESLSLFADLPIDMESWVRLELRFDLAGDLPDGATVGAHLREGWVNSVGGLGVSAEIEGTPLDGPLHTCRNRGLWFNAVGDHQPDGELPAGTFDAVFVAVEIGAIDTAITLRTVTVELTAGQANKVLELRLVQDANTDGLPGGPDDVTLAIGQLDGEGAETFDLAGLQLADGESEELLVVADLATDAPFGAEYRLTLTDAQIDEAEPVVGLPVDGATLTILEPDTDPELLVSRAGLANRNVERDETDVVLLALRLDATHGDITVDRLQFAADGSAQEHTDIARMDLLVDVNGDDAVTGGDTLLATVTFVANDATVDMAVGRVVPAGGRLRLLLAITPHNATEAGATFHGHLTSVDADATVAGLPLGSRTLTAAATDEDDDGEGDGGGDLPSAITTGGGCAPGADNALPLLLALMLATVGMMRRRCH